MRTQDIKIGEFYRHINNTNYGYAKAIKVIKPLSKYKQKYTDFTEEEKKVKFTVIKCEWTISKKDNIGFIKYFRPCNLVKESNNEND